MDTIRLAVKDKGRTVLPVALQRACEFAPGDELVARPIGKGRFIVESTDAVLERIRSRVSDTDDTNAVEGLHDWRSDTDAARRARLEAPELDSEEESARRGAHLLAELGL